MKIDMNCSFVTKKYLFHLIDYGEYQVDLNFINSRIMDVYFAFDILKRDSRTINIENFIRSNPEYSYIYLEHFYHEMDSWEIENFENSFKHNKNIIFKYLYKKEHVDSSFRRLINIVYDDPYLSKKMLMKKIQKNNFDKDILENLRRSMRQSITETIAFLRQIQFSDKYYSFHQENSFEEEFEVIYDQKNFKYLNNNKYFVKFLIDYYYMSNKKIDDNLMKIVLSKPDFCLHFLRLFGIDRYVNREKHLVDIERLVDFRYEIYYNYLNADIIYKRNLIVNETDCHDKQVNDFINIVYKLYFKILKSKRFKNFI